MGTNARPQTRMKIVIDRFIGDLLTSFIDVVDRGEHLPQRGAPERMVCRHF
jgi:hypothetical protein